MKKRILFFVPERNALTSAILHSQVLSVVRFLSENGFECMFIGCIDEGGNECEAEKIIKDKYGISVIIRAVYTTRYGYLGIRLTSWRLQRATKNVIKKFRPAYIYSRSVASSEMVRKMAKQFNAVSVLDVRAALSEEIKLRKGKTGFGYRYIRYLENKEFEKSEKLLCVSQNLKRYITSIVERPDIAVIPCCFDKCKFRFDPIKRKKIRKKFGFKSNEKVVCYSGGMAMWQRVDDIIALFESLHNSDQKYKFLFVTREIDVLKKKLSSSLLSNDSYVLASCAQDEVYQYLSSADAGILMREDTIVNNVASPIKVAEYLACGLPIILTKGVGDVSFLVSNSSIGLLLDEAGDVVDQVSTFMKQLNSEETRRNAIKLSHAHFSMKTYIEEYRRIYS